MPRKKTIQPEPKETLVTTDDDGNRIEVELYEDGNLPRSRGSNNMHQCHDRAIEALTKMLDMKVSIKSLARPNEFVEQCRTLGLIDEDEDEKEAKAKDPASWRKNVFKKTRHEADVLFNAIEKIPANLRTGLARKFRLEYKKHILKQKD